MADRSCANRENLSDMFYIAIYLLGGFQMSNFQAILIIIGSFIFGCVLSHLIHAIGHSRQPWDEKPFYGKAKNRKGRHNE